MDRLEIPKSLIPLIQKYTGKEKLNPNLIEDLNIIRKVNAAYQDCRTFLPIPNVFNFIIYNIIREFYKIPLIESQMRNKYISMILNNKEVRHKLLTKEPKSEFFSVIKDIMPHYTELQSYIETNNYYMVVMKYKEITKILESETLQEYNNDELKEECQKRYNFPNNKVEDYHYRMNNKKYPDKPDIYKLVSKGFYSSTCFLLANYFHDIMLEYYQNHDCYYSPINEELSYYCIFGIKIIGYNHDDILNLSINGYKWNKYEFWALLNMSKKPHIHVDNFNIRKELNFSGKILIAPNEFIEEAIISYLIKELGEKSLTNDIKSILNKIGIPEVYYYTNMLLTSDERTYYVNPKKYDYLKIKSITKMPTLYFILAKNEEDREKYIKKLIATYKGHHKEEEEEITFRLKRKENPKAWID